MKLMLTSRSAKPLGTVCGAALKRLDQGLSSQASTKHLWMLDGKKYQASSTVPFIHSLLFTSSRCILLDMPATAGKSGRCLTCAFHIAEWLAPSIRSCRGTRQLSTETSAIALGKNELSFSDGSV